jgi:porin
MLSRAARARRWCSLLLSGATLLAPGIAGAQEAEPDANVGATYTTDILANLRGGIDRGLRQLGKLDVTGEVDGSVVGIDMLSFHADVQLIHGGGFSDAEVGDAQVVSNIDAPPGIRPLEAYAAMRFGPSNRGVIKAGLVDLNSDFDVQVVGAFFINSSHGIGPDFSQTGRNGPSIFPTTASAVTVQWAGRGWTARVGLFDALAGNADRPRRTVLRFPGESGALLVGEVDVAIGRVSVRLGGWSYTSNFDAIKQGATAPRRQIRGNRGLFGLIEGSLAKGEETSLDAWARIGAANSTINPIGLYLGGGLTYRNGRNRVGLALGHARLGDASIRAGKAFGARPDRAETVLEVSFRHQFSDTLSVQPDVQYVINPDWNPSRGNALVAGMRLQVTLF